MTMAGDSTGLSPFPDYYDRRSGEDRRQSYGRRRSDLDEHRLQGDIREIRDELKLMSQAIQKIAIQEERITALTVGLTALKTEQGTLHGRITTLQGEHDRCHINRVVADIVWLKWFTMGNTLAILGAVLKFLLTRGEG